MHDWGSNQDIRYGLIRIAPRIFHQSFTELRSSRMKFEEAEIEQNLDLILK